VKTRTKNRRAPAIVVADSAPTVASDISRENLHVAAGVQNLLLAGTAAALASFWASPPDSASPRVCRCAASNGSHMVGRSPARCTQSGSPLTPPADVP
jgi:hypothetical protein